MNIIEQSIAFHDRFWAPERVASVEDIAAIELRLGTRLPRLLREVFLRTSLRSSQQLHLIEEGEVVVRERMIVFGRDQQGCGDFAVSSDDVDLDDPPIHSTMSSKTFEREPFSLSQWLRFFWIVNRPFEAPCADVALEDEHIAAWVTVPSIGGALAIDEDMFRMHASFVYGLDYDALGARTNADLQALLKDLDEIEFAEVRLL